MRIQHEGGNRRSKRFYCCNADISERVCCDHVHLTHNEHIHITHRFFLFLFMFFFFFFLLIVKYQNKEVEKAQLHAQAQMASENKIEKSKQRRSIFRLTPTNGIIRIALIFTSAPPFTSTSLFDFVVVVEIAPQWFVKLLLFARRQCRMVMVIIWIMLTVVVVMMTTGIALVAAWRRISLCLLSLLLVEAVAWVVRSGPADGAIDLLSIEADEHRYRHW